MYVLSLQSGFFQYIPDSICRIGSVMFNTRKTLFLSGCNDMTVHQQRGGAVVIKSGYAKNRFQKR